jgi:hypothetical protein
MSLTDQELQHISERRVNYSALIVPKAAEEIRYLRNLLARTPEVADHLAATLAERADHLLRDMKRRLKRDPDKADFKAAFKTAFLGWWGLLPRVSFTVGNRRIVATLLGRYPRAVHLRDDDGKRWIVSPEAIEGKFGV